MTNRASGIDETADPNESGSDAGVKEPKRRSKSRLFKSSVRTNSLLGVQIVGSGSYVPDLLVTNKELENRYGFEEGWVEQRTGILERRYAAHDQGTSDLAVEAALNAIKQARVSAADIDLLVVGTFTPDFTCPSTACLVQEKLGLDAPAMDVHAACSGFMYALSTAMQYVATGNSKLALVIGADVNSRIVQPTDQRTAPLFGDGAGAVLIARGESDQGFVCYQLGADGSGAELLDRPSGGVVRPATKEDLDAGLHFLQMDGRNVFKWAIEAVSQSIDLVVKRAGVEIHEISLFAFHQANLRIIRNAVEQLGISPERVLNNLDRYGNTSGASIPLVLDEAIRNGRVERGDNVLMCGFGAGLTWGTGIYRM